MLVGSPDLKSVTILVVFNCKGISPVAIERLKICVNEAQICCEIILRTAVEIFMRSQLCLVWSWSRAFFMSVGVKGVSFMFRNISGFKEGAGSGGLSTGGIWLSISTAMSAKKSLN
jgi:hypothetical protein